MEKNVGKTDRAVRFILGLVFAFLGYEYSAWFYVVAVILLATSFIGFCGLYPLLKINTLKGKKK